MLSVPGGRSHVLGNAQAVIMEVIDDGVATAYLLRPNLLDGCVYPPVPTLPNTDSQYRKKASRGEQCTGTANLPLGGRRCDLSQTHPAGQRLVECADWACTVFPELGSVAHTATKVLFSVLQLRMMEVHVCPLVVHPLKRRFRESQLGISPRTPFTTANRSATLHIPRGEESPDVEIPGATPEEVHGNAFDPISSGTSEDITDAEYVVDHKSRMRRSRPPHFFRRTADPPQGARYDGNTARLARRSDDTLGVRINVARIAPSLLDFGRAENLTQFRPILVKKPSRNTEIVYGWKEHLKISPVIPIKFSYDRAKRCREHKINIKASERVNVTVRFLPPKRIGFDSRRGRSRILACTNRVDAAGRRVFSGISCFPGPFILALLHTHLASRATALKTSLSKTTRISPLQSDAALASSVKTRRERELSMYAYTISSSSFFGQKVVNPGFLVKLWFISRQHVRLHDLI
ncbi:hypothetical protein PR048_000585 [Dryococelus australis]|uniref:Uncharacterized protein n=1 Tax=Dryococelus australis TaxID=614101 RepID=A0ABQ9IF21_9NEOP|nr:hypothetical protein PR048_000585 [Dryococelus australis]